MEFQDHVVPCDACGQSFQWSAGEQAFFAERGFAQPPRRCVGARKVRKATGTTERYEVCPFNLGTDMPPTLQPPRVEGVEGGPIQRGEPRRGAIVKVLLEKGFGFVRDEEGQDYYFNRRDLLLGSLEEMAEGTEVSFEAVPTSKGFRAHRVSTPAAPSEI